MDVEPQPDEKKVTPPPEDFKREDIEFFQELPIYINVEGIEPFTVFMRPLKVKEILILNRVAYLQEKNADCNQAAMMLVNLAVQTVNVTGDELPVETTSGLIANMIEFNFPKEENTPDNKNPDKKKAPVKKDGLLDCFDFLISHGHRYIDIMEYPVPLFNNFIVTTAERLGIKKTPEDPAAAFRKLGLPIKPRGKKK